MRRTAARPPARAVAGAVLAVAAVAAVGGLAAPVYGAASGSLEVSPYSVEPGGQVTVNTKGCGKKAAAAGDASAVGAGPFTLAPGSHEGEAVGRFRVPDSAQPGTYEIVAQCADGDREVKGDLIVTLMAAQGQVEPRGSVKTGVGGGLGRDPVRTAAGVAALAVAAAGGTWLLHRRARGDGI
ncbi:hypothetical protein [Streptomyces sp. CB01373]|uniref:hypothetical protein n=1 Tax=Streptomyces sp. CB01373 TaxID=2020325 RepID=UPI000C276E7F|nr:hypothetical protein [Streptomyces sp. CB01373]PJM97077.1 hypothetical protein CG719_03295 [Streptomyces sp. CB01373]